MVKEIESANARTIAVNQQLIESNHELIDARDKINQETISSEMKDRKINDLNLNIKALEEIAEKNKGTDNSSGDEVKKLKDEVQRAKEFCDTYEMKITKLKEEHKQEVNELVIDKLKVEDELRSVVSERQKMKDTERILLQTFDTLKDYYDQNGQKFTCSHCGQDCGNALNLKKH